VSDNACYQELTVGRGARAMGSPDKAVIPSSRDLLEVRGLSPRLSRQCLRPLSTELDFTACVLSTTRLAVSQALANDSGEISNCYLRVLQLGMPNLLPLETVEALVSDGP
jgi:hypothetical protein